jgi:hypothetical protein
MRSIQRDRAEVWGRLFKYKQLLVQLLNFLQHAALSLTELSLPPRHKVLEGKLALVDRLGRAPLRPQGGLELCQRRIALANFTAEGLHSVHGNVELGLNIGQHAGRATDRAEVGDGSGKTEL